MATNHLNEKEAPMNASGKEDGEDEGDDGACQGDGVRARDQEDGEKVGIQDGRADAVRADEVEVAEEPAAKEAKVVGVKWWWFGPWWSCA